MVYATFPVDTQPACIGATHIFDRTIHNPHNRRAVLEAQQLCATCPAIVACARTALRTPTPIRNGVWAGIACTPTNRYDNQRALQHILASPTNEEHHAA